MRESREKRLLLLLVLVAVAGAAYRFWPGGALSPPSSSAPRANGNAGHGAPSATAAPDVRLRALNEERPKPGDGGRNLFRFQSRPAAATGRPAAVERPAPPGPPPPPSIPPIPLKFIGVVEATLQSQKIAVLSDVRGVYYGHEGEVVEGRYRILRIGAESIEMSYLDGRGRQVIRLSGS